MLPIKGYKKLLLKNQFEIIDFQQHNLFAVYNTPEEIQKYIRVGKIVTFLSQNIYITHSWKMYASSSQRPNHA